MKILESQDSLRAYAGPGHWNDPDMLEVGNGMSLNEDRAHFTMWSMIAAPLISGNDLRNMSPGVTEILTNREVIAINQDSLGIQGFKYASKDSFETWMKPLSNGAWAVTYLNRKATVQPVEINWQNTVITDTLSKLTLDAKTNVYRIRNAWTKKDLGDTKKPLKASVPPHDVLVLVLKK
jgi:alpha-galactosidase